MTKKAAAEMVTGHSTVDALRILHHELQQQLQQHQSHARVKVDWIRFLHHGNAYSLLHWTSVSIIIVCCLLLVIAFAADENRDNWLIVEALILLLLLVFNMYFVVWDDRLRRTELISKGARVLAKIEACIKQGMWCPSNYIDLNCPLSQCVSLQWTIRDASVINLPVGLLVEGDVILLRPGQVIPAKCHKMKTGDYEDDLANVIEFVAGDLYNPAQNLPEIELFSKIEAREPLKPQAFLVLETPFVKNFQQILEQSLHRPVGMLDNERFAAYCIWIERRILPMMTFFMILTNALRYAFLEEDVGNWPEMILVLTVNSAVPLLALVFPIVWRLLDAWGVAKVILTFEESTQCNHEKKRVPSGGSFKSDTTLEGALELKLAWKDIFRVWKGVLAGNTDSLPRTANLVQVLGNMTSFCCVDKKGVLSWPNPTAEKVFVLTSRPTHPVHARARHHSEKSKTPDRELHLPAEGGPVGQHSKTDHNTKSFPAEVSFQVLDLTQDTKNHYGLRFDDPSWAKYLSSLKPLGLNILLNTCNMETTYKYTEFADHVTCVSLKREEAVPVVNRRCFCELAHQIGFSEKAGSNFTTQQTLGMYRHIPPESTTSERKLESSKSFIKYQMPMPNTFSVVVRDNFTGDRHLFSQGMADLLLDACSDFWDGQKLQPLGDGERKKIADFYHRTSMSSYCTAFSYRPLTGFIGKEFTDIYLEVPEDVIAFHGPPVNRTYGSTQYDKRHLVNDRPYHGSAESLLVDDPIVDVRDVEGCFRSQCSQVFIGMITMQYQAKQDIVDLIESLESSCIRFVHFSKENELRSRVFSEKMGLEAGWNCHISLASGKPSETKPDANESTGGNQESSVGYESQFPSQNLDYEMEDALMNYGCPTNLRPSWLRGGRYGSAPEIAMAQVPSIKSPVTPEKALMLSQELTKAVPLDSGMETGRDVDPAPLATTPLLRHRSSNTDPVVTRRRHPSERAMQTATSVVSKSESRLSLHRQRKRSSADRQSSSVDQLQDKVAIVVDGDGEDADELIPGDVASDSYMLSRASSCSDSFGGALGLSNRAKLPRGIENIRPHIKNVDNVPLQVSLFTDCTAHTTQEMLCILQEFGEVTCCIGSSANIANTGIFLQADCSLAVEPTYPQICIHHNVIEKPTVPVGLAPMELCTELHSLPCSLYFASDDHSTIIHLVSLARHHCQRIRSVSKLYLTCQVSLALFQLLNSVLLLPPALPANVVLWLAVIVVPLLSLTLMGNPLDRKMSQMAQGKNRTHFAKQTLFEELVYFVIRYVPTLAVCLVCHGLNLWTFCQNKVLPTTNVTSSCHILLGARGSEQTWNSWNMNHRSGLVLSQQIVTFQLVLYFVSSSFCSIHRLSYLWEKSPFGNCLWCIVIPVIILLQVIFFAANTSSANNGSDVAYSLSDIPIAVWIIAFLWPLLLVSLHELVKRQEVKMWVRHQKRARLDFGTKLGMNSPF